MTIFDTTEPIREMLADYAEFFRTPRPFSERRKPSRLADEDLIKEEYKDVFEAVDCVTGRGSNIDIVYSSSCTWLSCVLDIRAKADRLKNENWDIFFEEVNTEFGDFYYQDFKEDVHNMIKEMYPDMWMRLDEKQTCFSGRSGGHFNIAFNAPEGFVEIRRCLDGFYVYYLVNVDYEEVNKFVDDLETVYKWLDQYIVDYWNGVCEGIREMREEDRREIEIYAPARALGAFLEMCTVQ
jgi:hypothetical protein